MTTRPRTADDFNTIRARMEELRRERDGSWVEKDTVSANELPLSAAAGQIKAGKPGIPGWRVTRRKRFTAT